VTRNPGAPAGPSAPDDLHRIAATAIDDVQAASDLGELDAVRSRYLGRGDGLLSAFRRNIGALKDADAKRQLGQTINELIGRVEGVIEERRQKLQSEAEAQREQSEVIDVTWPPPPLRRGELSPITRAAREINRIFGQLGYSVASGPEVEYDRYNFTLVNEPPGHPARDAQDTFYIDDSRLLRSHTSPVQIRSMVQHGAPQRVIAPGKAFRRDYDATHMPMFHQVEGLCIDEGIALSDLKGTLEYFARSMFGAERDIRISPDYFPFTEPSLQVQVSCMGCGGEGCPICKHTGWLEILGSGMVHPQVLRNGGVDPHHYTGFAFGMGIERVAMLAYGIQDMRLLYENDVRFIHPVS